MSMDKLQWFKFCPSDYMMGKIQKCPELTQAKFIKLCCLYWNKQGLLSYEDAEIETDADHLKILCEKKVVKVVAGNVAIMFLDEQIEGIDAARKQASAAGKASAERRRRIAEQKLNDTSTTVEQPLNDSPTESNRVEESRREKKREEDIVLLEKEPKGPSDQFRFLELFNESKKRIRGVLKRKHETLTLVDQRNLKKILKDYGWEDVQYAVDAMLCAEYPKAHALDNPAHVLRNENFLKYLHVENLNQLKNGNNKPDRDQQAIDYLTRPR